MVFGLNIIGLRRAKFSAAQRDEIKRAFKLLYLSGSIRNKRWRNHAKRNGQKSVANFSISLPPQSRSAEFVR